MVQGSGVAISCDVGHRRGLDPSLLWLGCRPAAVAPICPLALKPSKTEGEKKKNQKAKKKKKKEEKKK